MLAEKDEEIAGLRGDVAFYERFVGSSGARKGLAVHSAEFAPEAGGSWRYEVVVTQSINRGGADPGPDAVFGRRRARRQADDA